MTMIQIAKKSKKSWHDAIGSMRLYLRNVRIGPILEKLSKCCLKLKRLQIEGRSKFWRRWIWMNRNIYFAERNSQRRHLEGYPVFRRPSDTVKSSEK